MASSSNNFKYLDNPDTLNLKPRASKRANTGHRSEYSLTPRKKSKMAPMTTATNICSELDIDVLNATDTRTYASTVESAVKLQLSAHVTVTSTFSKLPHFSTNSQKSPAVLMTSSFFPEVQLDATHFILSETTISQNANESDSIYAPLAMEFESDNTTITLAYLDLLDNDTYDFDSPDYLDFLDEITNMQTIDSFNPYLTLAQDLIFRPNDASAPVYEFDEDDIASGIWPTLHDENEQIETDDAILNRLWKDVPLPKLDEPQLWPYYGSGWTSTGYCHGMLPLTDKSTDSVVQLALKELVHKEETAAGTVTLPPKRQLRQSLKPIKNYFPRVALPRRQKLVAPKPPSASKRKLILPSKIKNESAE